MFRLASRSSQGSRCGCASIQAEKGSVLSQLTACARRSVLFQGLVCGAAGLFPMRLFSQEKYRTVHGFFFLC